MKKILIAIMTVLLASCQLTGGMSEADKVTGTYVYESSDNGVYVEATAMFQEGKLKEEIYKIMPEIDIDIDTLSENEKSLMLQFFEAELAKNGDIDALDKIKGVDVSTGVSSEGLYVQIHFKNDELDYQEYAKVVGESELNGLLANMTRETQTYTEYVEELEKMGFTEKK